MYLVLSADDRAVLIKDSPAKERAASVYSPSWFGSGETRSASAAPAASAAVVQRAAFPFLQHASQGEARSLQDRHQSSWSFCDCERRTDHLVWAGSSVSGDLDVPPPSPLR